MKRKTFSLFLFSLFFLSKKLSAKKEDVLALIREEFPIFVKKTETNYPDFIHFLNKKNDDSLLFLKQKIWNTLFFTTLSILINKHLPYEIYFHTNLYGKTKPIFKNFLPFQHIPEFASHSVLEFLLTSGDDRILNLDKRELSLFFLKKYMTRYIFKSFSNYFHHDFIDNNTYSSYKTLWITFTYLLEICPIVVATYNLNSLKKIKIVEEKKFFLEDLSHLMENYPESQNLRNFLIILMEKFPI